MKKIAFILIIVVILLSSLAHAESSKVSQFRERVYILNNIIGTTLFYNIKDLGDGIVQLTATDLWVLVGTPSDKAGNVHTLFKLWKAVEGSGLPVAVYIVNSNGRTMMSENDNGLTVY